MTAETNPRGAAPSDLLAPVLVLFTATTFLSALLLFSVQPMFAKMVLPVLGGSPSVWAVALCFFQGALLAGYAYAHVLMTRVPAQAAGIVHLAVCLLAFVVLPIALPKNWGEPPAGEPYLWQLGLFAVAVGLPFFAVSANAPLLQAWFSRSDHSQARDPYFMYAASNLGSLLALLGYPFVLEPLLGLHQLSVWWTAGYALLVIALALCFWWIRPMLAVAPAESATEAAIAPNGAVELAPTWSDRLGWIGLALVPSALLTAFTTHISTDVASAPLIWVVPLSLYLLTFVLVFRDRPIVFVPCLIAIGIAGYPLIKFGVPTLLEAIGNILPASLAPEGLRDFEVDRGAALSGALVLIVAFVWAYHKELLTPRQGLLWVHLTAVVLTLLALSQTRHSGWVLTASLGVVAFFTSAMVAHRTLFEARPPARYLTEFYLSMSLGGVLGGIFASLIAPRIFSEIFEYPLLLALTMACRPRALTFDGKRNDELMRLFLIGAAGILALYWVPVLAGKAGWTFGAWGTTPVIVLFMAIAMLALFRHPLRQLAVALTMFLAIVVLPSAVKVGDAQRSYFGVYRVYVSPDGDFNLLTHGTTLHGAQRIRDDKGNDVADTTPVTYYHPKSPMARSVATARERATAAGRKMRVGIVGLGTGSLACHSQPGESWKFFEIDPVIVGIANGSGYFTFIENCLDKLDVVIGDARLTLAKEPNDNFDLIIVDAFSSDAIPVHLITAEAMKVYQSKIRPDGMFVLHISNRYLDLDSVLAATAPKVPGLYGVLASDDTSDGTYATSTSTAGIFARSEDVLAPVLAWTEIEVKKLGSVPQSAWTDDYSDVLGPFLSRLRQ